MSHFARPPSTSVRTTTIRFSLPVTALVASIFTPSNRSAVPTASSRFCVSSASAAMNAITVTICASLQCAALYGALLPLLFLLAHAPAGLLLHLGLQIEQQLLARRRELLARLVQFRAGQLARKDGELELRDAPLEVGDEPLHFGLPDVHRHLGGRRCRHHFPPFLCLYTTPSRVATSSRDSFMSSMRLSYSSLILFPISVTFAAWAAFNERISFPCFVQVTTMYPAIPAITPPSATMIVQAVPGSIDLVSFNKDKSCLM